MMEDDGTNGTNGANGTASLFSVREFAKRIGRSTKTLYRWDKAGVLKAHRYPSGRFFYTDSQLTAVLNGADSPQEQ